MMQKYGNALWQIMSELEQKMNNEMLVGMGEILTKHVAVLWRWRILSAISPLRRPCRQTT